MWEPKDPQGDARNADPRMISQKGETANEAEAKVLAILKRRALDK
jgi:hypothetical protein